MATSPQSRISTGIILVTLVLCAFFLAQGATRVLAARVLGPEPGADRSERPRFTARAPSSLKRRRDPRIILRRNIFDSERGDLTQEPYEEVPVGENPESVVAEWDPSQPLPLCDNTRVVGAVVNPEAPDWSYAAIADSGETLLYRKGSNVNGSFVLAVHRAAVIMQPSSGSPCQAPMFNPEAKEQPPPKRKTATAADRAAERRKREKNANLSDEELDQGIEKVSDTRYNLERRMVDKLLGNQASLMRAARVIPHEEDGRVVGVKLYGIRRTSLLGRLGIQNGDMLRTINGFEMANPDSVLEAYARLRSADQISVALTRRGKPMTVEYKIQ